jgi:prolyl 4-hydroxylase
MSQPTLQQALDLINGGRVEEGMHMLRTLASTRDPQAVYMLARMTWSGQGIPANPERGRLLFEYAADLGHGPANLLATNLVASGIAGRRDWQLAIERLATESRKVPIRLSALQLIQEMELDANGDPLVVPEPVRLSIEPDARIFKGLLTEAECSYVMRAAEPLLEPSMVYNDSGEQVRDTIRTSDGAGFYWLIEDPAIHALNRRIAKATGTDYGQGEPLQVLRYAPEQEYRPHFDYLEAFDNPRPWTALIYLNDGYEGGATRFVKTGLEVRGDTGDVLVFGNGGPDGKRDPLAEHAGLPVTAGRKYLATRWIRQSRLIP